MTPQEIREILDKSGYLFEQKVASIIERLGYYTATNKAFLDQEENKSREIDVVAHKQVFKIESTRTVTGVCYLNCECKNSANPLVFITREKGVLAKNYKPDGIFLADDKYYQTTSGTRGEFDAFYYMELDHHHFATKTNKKAVQICKITRNGSKFEAQHTGIIEGFVFPLIKSKNIWEKQTPTKINNNTYCKLFFNLAVVNSKLYTIDSEIEDALPIEVNFVPFIREVRTREIDGEFLITFVTADYLEEFISKEIESFCEAVHQTYIQRPELLLNPALISLF